MPTEPSVLSTTLDWVSNHLNIAGWPALIWVAIRATWKSSRYVSTLETRASNVEATVNTIRDNHLKHIQDGIETLNTKIDSQTDAIVAQLAGVRSDLMNLAMRKD